MARMLHLVALLLAPIAVFAISCGRGDGVCPPCAPVYSAGPFEGGINALKPCGAAAANNGGATCMHAPSNLTVTTSCGHSLHSRRRAALVWQRDHAVAKQSGSELKTLFVTFGTHQKEFFRAQTH